MSDGRTRCGWCVKTDEERRYHDTEWGVPLYDDRKFFEFIVLDAFQAGLSWLTVLRKRENFRYAFDDFDPIKISRWDEEKMAELMQDAGIIRNKLKIRATKKNAEAFLGIQKEFGSFADYIWQFTSHRPIVNKRVALTAIPVSTPESDAMSKDLKKRGFTFVGTTICYSFMQAAGMVNDHADDCFRKKEIIKLYRKK